MSFRSTATCLCASLSHAMCGRHFYDTILVLDLKCTLNWVSFVVRGSPRPHHPIEVSQQHFYPRAEMAFFFFFFAFYSFTIAAVKNSGQQPHWYLTSKGAICFICAGSAAGHEPKSPESCSPWDGRAAGRGAGDHAAPPGTLGSHQRPLGSQSGTGLRSGPEVTLIPNNLAVMCSRCFMVITAVKSVFCTIITVLGC